MRSAARRVPWQPALLVLLALCLPPWASRQRNFASCLQSSLNQWPCSSQEYGLRKPGRASGSSTRLLAAALPAMQDAPPVSDFWPWRDHTIHYLSLGPEDGKPVLLVHGFGVNGMNFRKTMVALASEGHRVYALDLLGFGRSSKPVGETYSLQLWEEQVVDFCTEFARNKQPWVLGGNSIGGIIVLGVASNFCSEGAGAKFGGVRGLVLFNCAAGMNNKLLLTSYRTTPFEKTFGSLLFSLVDFLLAQEFVAQWGFSKLATKETVSDLLRKVYVNPEAVDAELVDGIVAPALEEGALRVFVKCLCGDPGIPPEQLISKVGCPVKMIWGDRDLLTPLGVGYGFFFRALDQLYPSQWSLDVVPAGHAPHDDAPEAVHKVLCPWLADLPLEAAGKPLPEFDLEAVLKLSFDPEALESVDNIGKLKL
ncbi:unnamed protein product [Polarella glacialis]|uniref:AB hydrolase-1 domain-containing protein n=1 Tax=Polarella glacialis TaxID=89957 RepID=A0A813KR27_POLGL|nr:unnamed protein product [Polarella glacialis]